MSSAVMSYSRWTSSNFMPPARLPTTTVIGTRVPRIPGFPCQMAGSITMRLGAAMVGQVTVNWRDLSSSARRNVDFAGPAPVVIVERLCLILDVTIHGKQALSATYPAEILDEPHTELFRKSSTCDRSSDGLRTRWSAVRIRPGALVYQALAMLKSQSLVPFKVSLLLDPMRALRQNCMNSQHRSLSF